MSFKLEIQDTMETSSFVVELSAKVENIVQQLPKDEPLVVKSSYEVKDIEEGKEIVLEGQVS